MKIRVRDSNIPRDQAMRSKVDLLLGHDERAVEQSEITDCALAIFANRERATGITRNMVAEDERARFFVFEEAKDLRRLAIKSFAKLDIGRNRLRPPIVFYMSILFNVAHVANFPEV